MRQGLVVHMYNPSMVEAGGLQVQGQPGLHSDIQSQTTNKKCVWVSGSQG
jgi:hypothetical protein